MITKEQQNKWLEIISLALDINRKIDGAYIFISVFPHVDSIDLHFHEGNWTFNSRHKPLCVGGIHKTEDWAIDQLKRLLNGEILYEDFYKEL